MGIFKRIMMVVTFSDLLDKINMYYQLSNLEWHVDRNSEF